MPEINYDDSGIIWIPRKNPELEAELDKLYPRIPGLLQWKVPHKGAFQLTFEFAKTVTSGKADPEVIEIRKKSCFGGTSSQPCPALVVMGEYRYCGGCQCGRWLLSALDGTVAPKLEWKFLDCPLRRPGFSNSL